jgi:hypothetical protein
MTTTMRCGSLSSSMSRHRLGTKLVSTSTTVSTSTVTSSPGPTLSRPLLLARIFSAIVIPIAMLPAAAPARRSS